MFQSVKDFKAQLFQRHPFLGTLQASLSNYWTSLKAKRKWHWLRTIVLIIAGVAGEYMLDEHMAWERFRYVLYQGFQAADLRPVRPKRTVLVLINNDEYWKGELAGRTPIKRDYLARLLNAVDKGEPAVIVLDFKLRSTVTDGGAPEHPQYGEETKKLIESIRDVSSRRKIVLPITTTQQEGQPDYIREPTIFDGNNFDSSKVGEGYISLPDDMRQIPLTVPNRNGKILDSLAAAAVRLTDKLALDDAEARRGDALPYGTFIDPGKFNCYSSTHVLTADTRILQDELGCKIVIIAGAWRQDGGRGEQADAVLTPAGRIGGQFAHANFIEALLDSRTFSPLAHWQRIVFGAFLSLLAAIVIASPWRVVTRLLIVFTLGLFPLIISYFLRQNLGIFFDSFLPIAMLLLHWLAERILS